MDIQKQRRFGWKTVKGQVYLLASMLAKTRRYSGKKKLRTFSGRTQLRGRC